MRPKKKKEKEEEKQKKKVKSKREIWEKRKRVFREWQKMRGTDCQK